MGTEQPASRLSTCRNAGELRSTFAEICREFGEVVNITALCGLHQSKTLLVVDLLPAARSISAVAERLGGEIFGHNSVAVSIERPRDFVCPKGFETPPPTCSCAIRN